jgi:Ca-activated chloride channel family protein
VGFLLDEIRLRGESKELRDEVTRLAREHGIVTPYTAFLILEDESRRNVPLSMQTMRELKDDAAAAGKAAGRYQSARDEAEDRGRRSGEKAVANAKEIESLKQQSNREQGQQTPELAKLPQAAPAAAGQPASPGPQPNGDYGYRRANNYAQQARVVNGRAFYQNGNTWTDATAQDAQAKNKALRLQQVKFNSEEYYALLKQHPDAAQWLSLGDEVDVVLGDTLYQIRG